MSGRPRVPGLNEDWADRQLTLDGLMDQVKRTANEGARADLLARGLDPLTVLREAMDAVEAAPYRPDPPVCRHCTHVADTPGGPVFRCQSAPGCLLDRLGPEKHR